jgi:GTP-binding protein HflX
VDVSHPQHEEQITVVNETLEEIGAQGKPTIMVFNKIDRIDARALIPILRGSYDNAVFIAALRGINMISLQQKIGEILDADITEETLTLSQADYPVLSQIHDLAEVLEKNYDGETITIRFRVNRLHADRLKKILARRGKA